jgi:hypothetical protein
MPHKRLITQGGSVGGWSSGGGFSLELSPTPGTITGLVIVVRPAVTTTTVTALNDMYDRIINTLSLTGGGRTYFSFTSMRACSHWARFRGHGMPRPSQMADSLTAQQTDDMNFAYWLHFGKKLRQVRDGRVVLDPYDLSAGIPPLSKGNLTLQGTWGTTAAPGTNVTLLAATTFDVYAYVVSQNGSEPSGMWLPAAAPRFEMASPTPTATSSLLQTTYHIPAGDGLSRVKHMSTRGAGAPRDDGVLGSLELYNQKGGQSIWRTDRYKASEIITQALNPSAVGKLWPPSDNDASALLATPSIGANADEGLVYLPADILAAGGHPVYGAPLGQVATGDLQLRMGVTNATTVTLDVVTEKYQDVAG